MRVRHQKNIGQIEWLTTGHKFMWKQETAKLIQQFLLETWMWYCPSVPSSSKCKWFTLFITIYFQKWILNKNGKMQHLCPVWNCCYSHRTDEDNQCNMAVYSTMFEDGWLYGEQSGTNQITSNHQLKWQHTKFWWKSLGWCCAEYSMEHNGARMELSDYQKKNY